MQEAASAVNGLLVLRKAAWKKRCVLFPEVMNVFCSSDFLAVNVNAGQMKPFVSL